MFLFNIKRNLTPPPKAYSIKSMSDRPNLTEEEKEHYNKVAMNKLKQLLSFLNEETPVKNSQIILESIFLTFLVIWFIIKG